jgi:hypothetical protein
MQQEQIEAILSSVHRVCLTRCYRSSCSRQLTWYRIFIWELFPEWIFPMLTGFSVLCLAHPTSHHFTRVFGGSNGNEGLGLFSLCFDWQYISAAWNPFVIPLKAEVLIRYSSYLLLGLVNTHVGFLALHSDRIPPWRVMRSIISAVITD